MFKHFVGMFYLILFLFAINLNADELKLKVIKSNPFHHFKAKEILSVDFLFSDYIEVAGDTQNNFDTYLSNALKNQHWQNAQNALYNQLAEIPYPGNYPDSLKITNGTPNWIEALKELHKFVEQTNSPLGAFQGLTVIQNFIIPFFPDKKVSPEMTKEIMQKYMPTFTRILKDKGFCYGYLMDVQYLWKYSDTPHLTAKNNEKGLSICKDQLQKKKIKNFVDEQFRVQYTKAKVTIELTQKGKK